MESKKLITKEEVIALIKKAENTQRKLAKIFYMIDKNKYYLELDYSSNRDFIVNEVNFISYSQVCRLINYYRTIKIISKDSPIGDTKESVIRPLTKVKNSKNCRKAWTKACELSLKDTSNKKDSPKTKHVVEAIKYYSEKNKAKTVFLEIKETWKREEKEKFLIMLEEHINKL